MLWCLWWRRRQRRLIGRFCRHLNWKIAVGAFNLFACFALVNGDDLGAVGTSKVDCHPGAGNLDLFIAVRAVYEHSRASFLDRKTLITAGAAKTNIHTDLSVASRFNHTAPCAVKRAANR